MLMELIVLLILLFLELLKLPISVFCLPLQLVCWLVKSDLRFTIMAVTIRSIPTDSTVDWRMLVSRSVLD